MDTSTEMCAFVPNVHHLKMTKMISSKGGKKLSKHKNLGKAYQAGNPNVGLLGKPSGKLYYINKYTLPPSHDDPTTPTRTDDDEYFQMCGELH